MASLIKCPECGKIISISFSIHECKPEMDIEWRYPVGSKTQPAHAYKVGSDRDAMPICGIGTIKRATKPQADASPKRKYGIWRCGSCLSILAGMEVGP
jgi:hypothetical protein